MAGSVFEFDSEDGSASILVELDDSQRTRGMVPVGAGGVTGKAAKKFEESLDTVKGVANAVVNKLNSTVSKPQEVTIEFGLKFQADANAYITKVSGEAHINLKMTWKND